MTVLLNPYVSFRDNARDAMTFYQGVFGGDLELNTFGDAHVSDDPAEANKIMHGMLTTPTGLVLMGADTPNSMEYSSGSSITISLSGDDEGTLRGYWDKLVDGGSVTVPLETAPWGATFGMLTDPFGVAWMVNIAAPESGAATESAG
ncbi:VOC family protein [Pseudarthrobacter sp. J75]|uniref:VOC family protein n=1 Tax=unclassified Pseudarthrobacter TaxID=2647000 RepID=UPI002E80CD0A|nr:MULTISPECIES: VOC family protein [unclassified Pseudarthrobacter]MEE2523015.1 VOC family protein [Pseudarthrobacter sp. J47]MEE2529698.1 VOC family protein [Pseudarthrobacter sp. J75]MEE2569007.1 VOC family protein [Pseudarthrobacter sp. J64]